MNRPIGFSDVHHASRKNRKLGKRFCFFRGRKTAIVVVLCKLERRVVRRRRDRAIRNNRPGTSGRAAYTHGKHGQFFRSHQDAITVSQRRWQVDPSGIYINAIGASRIPKHDHAFGYGNSRMNPRHEHIVDDDVARRTTSEQVFTVVENEFFAFQKQRERSFGPKRRARRSSRNTGPSRSRIIHATSVRHERKKRELRGDD